MPARVTKPAFNLRDKLTQLDYAELPYEKVQKGGIVQTHIKYTGNATFTTSSATWNSLDVGNTGNVDFAMKFTPRFHNSIIVFETDMISKHNDEDGYVRFRLVDMNHPNGTTVFHSNTYCAAAHYYIETDEWINTHICTKGPVQHMGEHNLVLQVFPYNGGTWSLSWSGSDYRTVRLTEIKQ